MPESLIADGMQVDCFVARGAEEGGECGLEEALAALDQPDRKVWINVLAPQADPFQLIAQKLKLHELAVEDVFSARSRAKVEPYDEYLFCIVPALNLTTTEDLFDVVNLNAFLGRNYLITAHRAALPATAHVRHWMNHKADFLRRGPDFVLYQLLDVVVDEYLGLSTQMNDAIDTLEERVLGPPDGKVPELIFGLKRQAAWLRRLISPQREIVNVLTNRPHEFIGRETQIYLRDVYDHVHRINESVDTFRDLLQGALDTYLTLVANRTNEVMKFLSVVATIVLPINMLTSLYGTNFRILPGSDHPYGFWVFGASLILIATVVTLIVRSRKWL